MICIVAGEILNSQAPDISTLARIVAVEATTEKFFNMAMSAAAEHYHGLVDMGRYVDYYLRGLAVLSHS